MQSAVSLSSLLLPNVLQGFRKRFTHSEKCHYVSVLVFFNNFYNIYIFFLNVCSRVQRLVAYFGGCKTFCGDCTIDKRKGRWGITRFFRCVCVCVCVWYSAG